MLRQQKHYSEGKQSSSGVTSRNHTKVNVYGFRIIYIMLTIGVSGKNINLYNSIYYIASLNCI